MTIEIWKEDGDGGDPTDIILRNPGDLTLDQFMEAVFDQLRDEYDWKLDEQAEELELPEGAELTDAQILDYFDIREPGRKMVRYVNSTDDDAEKYYDRFCIDSDTALLVRHLKHPIPPRWEEAFHVGCR